MTAGASHVLCVLSHSSASALWLHMTPVCFLGIWCRNWHEYETAFPGTKQNPWSSEDAGPQACVGVCIFVPYRRLHLYQTLDVTLCTAPGGPWQIASVFWTSTAAWSSSCIGCTLSACSVGESLTKWRPCSMPGIFSPLPLNTREVRLFWLRQNGVKTSTFCLMLEINVELRIEVQIFNLFINRFLTDQVHQLIN